METDQFTISTFHLTFSVFGLLVDQVRTIDPHPTFNSTSALVSMSKVARTTLATHAAASSTRNKNANAEQEVTATKVTGLAAGLMMNRSTLARHPSSLQGLMEDHYG